MIAIGCPDVISMNPYMINSHAVHQGQFHGVVVILLVAINVVNRKKFNHGGISDC